MGLELGLFKTLNLEDFWSQNVSKNNIKVTISSDLDYENLIAEIIADGEFIGLLTAEPNQQVCFELPEGQGNWNKIEANLLIEALQIARKELLQD